MQEILSRCIADLLYEHERLTIPGLGSFEHTHAPALIDQIQGEVHAPSRFVKFNANIIMDDGVLLDCLQNHLKLTTAQTTDWLEQEVAHIKEALQRKDIVEIPGVGRLFLNFEQQLQFVAESSANFNIDAFGLQSIAAQPILRQQHERQPIPPTPSSTTAQTNINPIAPWYQAYLPWLIAVALVLIGASIYFLGFNNNTSPATPATTVPIERLNTSPSNEQTTDPATPPAPEQPTQQAATPTDTPAPIAEDTEAPTLPPHEHEAIIAVGLYGKKENTERMVRKLSTDGYSVFTEPEGKYMRVGVSIRYSHDDELRQALKEAQRAYTSSAFVMYVDGERVKR
ncbi:MAG: SPOR domain-containing protein [Saprospiraceae bacterium]